MKHFLFISVALAMTGCNFNLQKPAERLKPIDDFGLASIQDVNLTFEIIRSQVFEKSCKECHMDGNKKKGVALDTYPETFAKKDAIYRTVHDNLMPEDLSTISRVQKAKLLAWIELGAKEFGGGGVIVPPDENQTGTNPVEPAPAPAEPTPVPAEPTPAPVNPAPAPPLLPPGVPGFAEVKARVFEVSCKRCHLDGNKKGGIALDTYALARPVLHIIDESVRFGSMPPRGSLSQAQNDTLFKWIEFGGPEVGTEIAPEPEPEPVPTQD